MYRALYDETRDAVALRYAAALATLDDMGVGATGRSQTRFALRLEAVCDRLASQPSQAVLIETPDGDRIPLGELQLRRIVAFLGYDGMSGALLAQALWGRASDGTAFPLATRRQAAILRLFDSATRQRERLAARAREFDAPFVSSPRELEAGRRQAFELLAEVPDLADEVYARLGYASLTGAPPRLRQGASASASAFERQLVADGAELQQADEVRGYARMGAVMAAGVLVTLASAGLGGGVAATLTGLAFGTGVGGYDLASSHAALARAQDHARVGAATSHTVRLREEDLIGARGALIVNAASLGLLARVGGARWFAAVQGPLASTVLRSSLVASAMGSVSGALTSATHPGVWKENADTVALLLRGALVGATAGALGGAAGGAGAAWLERRAANVTVALPRGATLTAGSEVQLVVEGESVPRVARVLSVDAKQGQVVVEDAGRRRVVSVAAVERVCVDAAMPPLTLLAGGKTSFVSASEQRERSFVEGVRSYAAKRQREVSELEARALYATTGAADLDPVTGFSGPRDRMPTVRAAIDHVRATGESAFYVEADIANLGGLNAKLGHSGANVVYGRMAEDFARELRTVGGSLALFRHGGDELSAVVVGPGVTRASVVDALERAQARIAERVRAEGLADIPHPKHKLEKGFAGTRLVTGVSEVRGTARPEEIVSAADRSVEANKLRGAGVSPSTLPATSPVETTPPAASQPARVGESRAIPERSYSVARLPNRVAFVPEAVLRREHFELRAQELGIDSTTARAFFERAGGMRADTVTGFADKGDRIPTLNRAIEHVRRTGEGGVYVELDVRNLGGLNAALGHSGANEVYGVFAGFVHRHLSKLSADVVFFRHGGDEMSAVVLGPGVRRAEVEAALADAQREVAQYVRARGLASLPHPKAKDDPSQAGTSLAYGTSEVGGTMTPADILGAADRVVERMKLKGNR